MRYPSGLILTCQRDTNGRISGISADGQSIVSNVAWQPFGPVSAMTMGGLSVTRSFDRRYQVSGIAAGTVMNLTYTHDGTGNVKTISGITKPPVAPGTTDYSIPAGSSRVSGSTGKTVKTYSYDNAGKITSDGTRTFTYNQNHRLVQVSAGQTVIAEYTYDGFARRVKKTVGSEITRFHYDYDGNLISETDGTGSPLRDYIYLNSEPVVMKLYGDQAGIYWFINDHLGTPQKMTDASGTVVWEAGYMPFGEARILLADIGNNLRFPGQYYDRETGLHYNYHRYYDPDTGRYLTPDPIGLEGGINLYAYVDGNPVNWVDPEGLSPSFDKNWDGVVDEDSDLAKICDNSIPSVPVVTAKDMIIMATPLLLGLPPIPPKGPFKGLNPDKKVIDILKGTGQIPALLRNKNLKGVDTQGLLSKTLREVSALLNKKQFKTFMKHFEGRDLRHGK